MLCPSPLVLLSRLLNEVDAPQALARVQLVVCAGPHRPEEAAAFFPVPDGIYGNE